MVVRDQVVAMGYLNLSAMRAFDSTDETATRWVKAVVSMVDDLGEGHVIVGETCGRILVAHDLVRNVNYIFVHSGAGKSEALGDGTRAVFDIETRPPINVGTIGHVSRDKGTLAEAVQKFSAQVIVDDMARGFAKQAVDKFVDEFNRMEAIKHTKPHITEKPYGKAHRRRFRR